MTDITNFGSSFPSFGSDKYQGFGGFKMKSFSHKKRGEDTERELAELLENLENIKSERVVPDDTDKKKDRWFLSWRNPDAVSEKTFEPDYSRVERPKGSILKKGLALISASFAVLQSFSFANSVTSSSAGTFFGIFNSVDSMLRTFCVAIAIGCGSLPFVVYALQIGGQGGAGAPETAPVAESSFRPHEGWYKRSHFELIDRVDPYATRDYDSQKAIMSNGRGLPKGEIPQKADDSLKPTAPKAKPYVVKDVINGMAMIEYDQGYWFARPGSTLPDGSYYVRVMKDSESGKLALKTSKGLVPVSR